MSAEDLAKKKIPLDVDGKCSWDASSIDHISQAIEILEPKCPNCGKATLTGEYV